MSFFDRDRKRDKKMGDKPISYSKPKKIKKLVDASTSYYGSKKEALIFFETQSETKSMTNEHFREDARARTDFGKKLRSVPSKKLTSAGFAVCFFPEHGGMEVLEECAEEVVEKVVRKKTVPKLDVIRKSKIFKLNKHKEKTDIFGDTISNFPKIEKYPRTRWRNRLTYLLALVSFSFSMNNIYHFPLLIYRYGGVFLIPYTIVTFAIGYPLHVIQTSFGQYSQRSLFKSWSCAPLCVGVGISMFTLNVIASIYYNLFGAYSLVYVVYSFNRILPWAYCTDIPQSNDTCVPRFCNPIGNLTTPSKQFFYNNILDTLLHQKHPPSDLQLGELKWWLILGLLVSWIMIYAGTSKTASSIGKVSTYSLIFSYFVLVTLFVAVAQLNDNWNSVKLVLESKTSVFTLKMWSAAITQVLYDLGICHGVPIVYGSYCHFRNSVHIDSFLLCLINYFNSILLFLLLFSFISAISCEIGGFPWDMLDNSFGIIYIMYSEAFSMIPGGHLWSILFFLMVFCSVIGRQIAIVETIMNAYYDNFVHLSRLRLLINILFCSVMFLFGLLFSTSNSFFVVSLMENVVVHDSIYPLCFLFISGVIVIYGLDNYMKTMQQMVYFRKLNLLLRLFLYFLVVLLFILSLVNLLLFETHYIGGKTFSESYMIVAKVLVSMILAPYAIWVVIWVGFSWYIQDWENITKPIEPWTRHEEMVKNRSHQFGASYNEYFLVSWNK